MVRNIISFYTFFFFLSFIPIKAQRNWDNIVRVKGDNPSLTVDSLDAGARTNRKKILSVAKENTEASGSSSVMSETRTSLQGGMNGNSGIVPHSYQISKDKSVGDIAYTATVSPNGSTMINIPIDMFNDPHDCTPHISIVYNSLGGNGYMGHGWGLNGLSIISRSNKSIYYDGKTEGIKGNPDDAFTLDGMRLIQTKFDGIHFYYKTVTGGIKAVALFLQQQLRFFTVYYPNGDVSEYRLSNGKDYYITKLTNRLGRTVTYSYDYVNGQYRINKILYGEGGVGKIEFSYKSSSICPIQYQNGSKYTIDYLLSTITTSFNGNELRKYNLSYTTKGLSNVVSQIDCYSNNKSLNPLLFYYGNNSEKAFSQSDTESQLMSWYKYTNPSDVAVSRGKFDYGNDNDGLIMYPNKVGYYLELTDKYNQKSKKFEDVRHVVNKYKGDEDIILSADLGQDFAMTSSKVKTGEGFVDIFSVDIDEFEGDEIIKVNNRKFWNRTDGIDSLFFTVYRSDLYYGFAKKYERSFCVSELYDDELVPKIFQAGDFNGDGKIEIMVVTPSEMPQMSNLGSSFDTDPFRDRSYPKYQGSSYAIIDLENNKVLYKGKSPFTYKHTMIGRGIDGERAYKESDKFYVLDYDSDGKSDIVIVKDDGTYFYSLRDGWTFSQKGVDKQLTKSVIANRRLQVGDFNGDGKFDFLLSPEKGTSFEWTIFANKGNGTFEKQTISLCSNNDDTEFFTQDMNMDGQTDLIRREGRHLVTYFISNMKPAGSLSTKIDANAIVLPADVQSKNTWYSLFTIHNTGEVGRIKVDNCDNENRLMTGMVNSYGVCKEFSYSPLNSNSSGSYETSGLDDDTDYKVYKGALLVNTGIKTYYNGNLLGNTTYRYYNAVFHKYGLGFCGFEGVFGRDRITNDYHDAYYDVYNFHNLLSEEDKNGKYTYTYKVIRDDKKIALNTLSKKEFYDKKNGVSTYTTYLYDDYGNMTHANATYGGGNYSFESRTYKNIDTDTSYTLGLILTEENRSVRKGSTMTNSVKNSYDSRDFLTTVEKFTNGNRVSCEYYVYDENNRIKSQSIKKFDSDVSHTISYTYDAFGQIATRTNALGQVEKNTYDDKGFLTCITDYNNNHSYIEYDDWGRTIKEMSIDSIVTSTTTSWSDGRKGSVIEVKKESTSAPTTRTFLNVLGQTVCSEETRFDGSLLKVDYEYDSKKRLSRTSMPYKTTPSKWTTNTYDSFDRITSVEYPSGKTEKYSYKGLQTTITKDGISTTKTYSTLGDVESIEDASGKMTISYNGNGDPVQILAPDNVVTKISYDKYGRRIKLEDPSAGTSTIEYDNAGNVSVTTDANGKQIKNTYDKYDRLVKRQIGNEDVVTYAYDKNGNLLFKRNSNGDSYNYSYDKLRHLTGVLHQGIDGNWLEQRNNYEKGICVSTKYFSKSGDITTQNYSYANGSLVAVSLDNGKEIYRCKKEDEFGRLTEYQTGGYLHKTTYDNDNHVTSLSCLYGSKTIQDFAYTYDTATGNLISRSDRKRSLIETFEYDNMNRLTRFGNETREYDDNGNVVFNSLLGNYKYDGVSPYAVTEVDNNRSLLSHEQRILEYNASNRVSSIKEGDNIASFMYDDCGNRIKMTYTGSRSYDYTRWYFDDIYELHSLHAVTKEFFYLGGDAYTANAVYYKTTGGKWKLYYICRDNLGSVTAIMDEDGEIMSEQSYDAWGNLRNPDTWEMYKASDMPELFTGRGYTGHEHLREFGLINMNARLYDPILGRFITPDPYVSCVDFLQNLNRYSYCMNNPFAYTDRSGKFVISATVIIVGAIIGAVAGVVIAAVNHQLHDGWDVVAAATMGAVTGAVGAAAGAVAGSYALAACGIKTVGFVGGLVYGAASGLASSLATEGINYMNTGQFNWGNVGWAVAGGALFGGISNGIIAKCQGKNFWTGKEIKPNATPAPVTSNKPDNVASKLQSEGHGSQGGVTTEDVSVGTRNNTIETVSESGQKYCEPGGKINWPANDGYVEGSERIVSMQEGMKVDRYSLALEPKDDMGTFFGRSDVIWKRSLPFRPEEYKYYQFKVLQCTPAKYGVAAPAFGLPGGAIQLQFLNPNNLQQVIPVKTAIEMKLIVPLH